MDQIKVISFLVLGTAAFVFNLKDKNQLKSTLLFLLTIASSFLILENIEENDQKEQLSAMLIFYVSFNFLISRFDRIRAKKWNFLIPLFSSFILLFIGHSTFVYNQYEFSFAQVPILAVLIFGSIIFKIAQFTGEFVSKTLDIKDIKTFENTILIFLVGFGVFIGSFVASHFGIFLVSLGVITQLFYQTLNKNNYGISLLFISLTHYFSVSVQLDVIDLSLGKTIEGIFIGFFTVALLNALSASFKKRVGLFLGLIVLVCTILFGVLLLSVQKSDFGGMDAFVCEIIGISLALAILPEFGFGEMLFSIVIAGGLFFGPMTINEEELKFTEIKLDDSKTNTREKNEVLFEMPGIPLDSIIGTYTIDEKSVRLAFKLGPKGGITKGSFRSFGGKINIQSKIENSKFEIDLPVDQLTTFNKLRDESIFDEDYLNISDFPMIQFIGNKLTRINDYYLLNGDFKMLGISKPLQVELKYIGKQASNGNDFPILVGRSSIDRTQFGMKPDSKEGNIVEFEFKIQLVK